MAISTNAEEHEISLEEASKWTRNYRQSISADEQTGGIFNRAAIESILSQEGCAGIKYYFAIDNDGNQRLVLVGIDEDANDLYEGFIAEKAKEVPPHYGVNNPLNS